MHARTHGQYTYYFAVRLSLGKNECGASKGHVQARLSGPFSAGMPRGGACLACLKNVLAILIRLLGAPAVLVGYLEGFACWWSSRSRTPWMALRWLMSRGPDFSQRSNGRALGSTRHCRYLKALSGTPPALRLFGRWELVAWLLAEVRKLTDPCHRSQRSGWPSFLCLICRSCGATSELGRRSSQSQH